METSTVEGSLQLVPIRTAAVSSTTLPFQIHLLFSILLLRLNKLQHTQLLSLLSISVEYLYSSHSYLCRIESQVCDALCEMKVRLQS